MINVIADLRKSFSGVRDQGSRPTCLAFASSDINGYHHRLSSSLSVEYLYYNAVQRMSPPDPHAGVSIDAVSEALKSNGQPLESAWPYLGKLPYNLKFWKPPDVSGAYWSNQLDVSALGAKQVRTMITNGDAVLIGLMLTEQFYAPRKNGYILPDSNDRITPYYHTVVGVAVGKNDVDEYFTLVRNSWGKKWGINGYAWIVDNYMEKQLFAVAKASGVITNAAN